MFSKETNKKIAVNRWKNFHDGIRQRASANFLKNHELNARILGYLFGDGSVIIRREKNGKIRYDVQFYPDGTEMLDAYIYAFNKLFGISPHCSQPRSFLLSKA